MSRARESIFAIILGIALAPAMSWADIVAVGEPIDIGSWSQSFRATLPVLDQTFDRIEFFLITPGVEFEAPGISGFSDEVWTAQMSADSRYLLAWGPATDLIRLTLSFLPDRSEPLAFDVYQFGGSDLADSRRLMWSGTGWTYGEAAPRSEYASAPETGTMLLLGSGLLTFAGLLRRRRILTH